MLKNRVVSVLILATTLVLISSIMPCLVTACEPTNNEPVGLRTPRELTEYEKERCTEAAVESTEEAMDYQNIEGLEELTRVNFRWMLKTEPNTKPWPEAAPHGWRGSYSLNEALNMCPIEESESWYIEVVLRFKRGGTDWLSQVIVDVETAKVVEFLIHSPDLSSPDRFSN